MKCIILAIYFNLPAPTEVSLGLSVTSLEFEFLHDFIVPRLSRKRRECCLFRL
jgi:hypothetical protein